MGLYLLKRAVEKLQNVNRDLILSIFCARIADSNTKTYKQDLFISEPSNAIKPNIDEDTFKFPFVILVISSPLDFMK